MHKPWINIVPLFILILFYSAQIFPQNLPPIKLDFSSYVLSSDGKLIGYIGEKKRVDVKNISNISGYVTQCLIATEDRDFYQHDGVSIKGLVRGLWNTITGNAQGGSTITMQLARNLFLSFEKTVSRKLSEIDLARELEKKYSKNEILVLYLNTVNFGHGAYGIWAASQEYFCKTPDQLSLAESATLVGLLQSPNGYDPNKAPQKLLNRRNEVLYNLVEVGKLSNSEFQRLKKTDLNLKLREIVGRHFLEHVRKTAVNIVQKMGLTLSKDELKITSTLNYDMQKAAEDAVNSQFSSLPKSMEDLQLGLVSVEPGTGMIKTMIGGNTSSESRGLNRAAQIHRQPGSSFKPFLYGKLLVDGYTLATPLLDSPIVVDAGKSWEWKPSNDDNSYSGKMIPMIDAIENSINLAAAYAITELTIPDSVVSFAHMMGIKSTIPSYPSIALGTGEVSPLEMAGSMAVFASAGIYAEPYSIIKIEDKNGNVIYSNQNEKRVVLDSATTYLLTTALQNVVNYGTAASVRKYFNGPAAGKTGTTQNYTDAWFVGYTPSLSTAVWVGYDNPSKKLTKGFQYGGTVAAPIWGRMMASISKRFPYLNSDFVQPTSVADTLLCVDSGELAAEFCTHTKSYFVSLENLPSRCRLHSPEEEHYNTFYAW
ncbi:MAG: PBP1A family penicillin-binding protein [Ignavibacteriaceae bacterium]|nr:PBP1A family penicillin-binding protein [Ignavibacteriaceae bacterium]